MSAYALPGLFPTISSDSSVTGNSSVGNSSRSDSCTFRNPLHQQNESSTFTGLLRASVDLLSVPSFTTNGNVRDIPADGSHDTKTSSSGDTRSEEPGIAVREAKIDPIGLIQSVMGTSPRSQPHARKTLRRRGSREKLATSSSSSGSSSPQGSPVAGKPSIDFAGEEMTQQQQSIAFELSISFNGRKYNATRTLQCIMELRDDLVLEMNGRRQWLQAASGAFSTAEKKPVDHDSSNSNIQIPEIPPMSGDDSNGGSGFVGRGFTMLHAMATQYVPVMERWLRNVMDVVPQDSECLTNFLWEPLSKNDAFPLDLPIKSRDSMATLGSIKELDYNTGDDDDDDSDDDDDDDADGDDAW
jgi:hypothetical protein